MTLNKLKHKNQQNNCQLESLDSNWNTDVRIYKVYYLVLDYL